MLEEALHELFRFAIIASVATSAGDGSVWGPLALYVAVLLAWIWLAALSYRMRKKHVS